jgi:hypothetical protein
MKRCGMVVLVDNTAVVDDEAAGQRGEHCSFRNPFFILYISTRMAAGTGGEGSSLGSNICNLACHSPESLLC